MALQTSGAISLANIQTEFGGSNPISLSEYYGAAAGVPTSGTINIGHFYGKSSQFAFTISTNQTNASLYTLATNAGWDGSSNLQATINSGVYISSNSTGTPALTVSGSYPAGVTLINNGIIVGRGGNGGNGGGVNHTGYAGSAGGNALTTSVALTVQNNGTIAGGGGGGGGGGASSHQTTVSDQTFTYYDGGGGGGGGRSSNAANSSGGSGGLATYNGASGSGGTVSASGSGGGGAYNAGAGGSGGNWGVNGSSGGSSKYAGGSGGSSGSCTSGNSNITWTATGTRLGALG